MFVVDLHSLKHMELTLEVSFICLLSLVGASFFFFFVCLSSIQSLSLVWLFAIPWTVARQASLSITNSRSLLKLMSIELVMPCNPFILYCPLLLPPSIFPSIRVFSNESVLVCLKSQFIVKFAELEGSVGSCTILLQACLGFIFGGHAPGTC